MAKGANDVTDFEKAPSKNLIEAAQRGRRSSIVRLIGEGADLQETNEQGETALHVAAKYATDDVNLEILKAGVDITKVDALGRTALHVAATEGKEELLKELLRQGSDVNAKDIKSNTPLHMAAGAAGPSRDGCGKLLLEARADLHLVNDAGYTPYGIADDMGSFTMKQLFENYGGARESPYTSYRSESSLGVA
jgi:ankyrin repeat protein